MIRTTKPNKNRYKKLTSKQLTFAKLIIENRDPNKKDKLYNYECYMKAYPNTPNKPFARVYSTALLKKPHVKHYIKQRQINVTKKIEIDLEYFIKGYQRIAKFDHRKLYDENKKVKHIADLDDDTAMGLSSIEFGTYQKTIKKKETTIKKMKTYLKNIKTESRKAALDSMREMLNIGGSQSTGSPEEFVQAARGFADDITDAVPGGEL